MRAAAQPDAHPQDQRTASHAREQQLEAAISGELAQGFSKWVMQVRSEWFAKNDEIDELVEETVQEQASWGVACA